MNLKRSFVVVWGLLYLICAVASPNMIENVGAFATAVSFSAVGGLILLGAVLIQTESLRAVGCFLLLGLGIFEAVCCWASWTGAIVWSVGVSGQATFQVSMALLDLVSAVVLMSVATEEMGDYTGRSY